MAKSFLREAEGYARQKREIQGQREKLKIEVNFQERVVTDKQVIADALLRFEEVFEALPTDKKMELLNLVIRRISVRRVEPKMRQDERVFGAYAMQLRTSEFQIKIQFYAEDLFSGTYKSGQKSSHLLQSGDPYGTRTRRSR